MIWSVSCFVDKFQLLRFFFRLNTLSTFFNAQESHFRLAEKSLSIQISWSNMLGDKIFCLNSEIYDFCFISLTRFKKTERNRMEE